MFRKTEAQFEYAENKDTYTNAAAILKQLESLAKQISDTTSLVDTLVKVIPELKDPKKIESTLKSTLQTMKSFDSLINSDNYKAMQRALQKGDKKSCDTYNKINSHLIGIARTQLPKFNKSMEMLINKMKSDSYNTEVNKYNEILFIEEVQQFINTKYNLEALAGINKLVNSNHKTAGSLITNIEKINLSEFKYARDDSGPDSSRI